MSRVCTGLIYNFLTYNFSTCSKNHVFYKNIILKYKTTLCTSLSSNQNGFHTSSLCFKRRKTKEERKAPKIIEYSPKSKNTIINVWKNMTVAQLAQSMSKDLDHVFEVMLYVDNTDNLHDEISKITDMQIIQDIVKKSGMRAKIVAPPENNVHNNNHRDKSEFQDAVPQPPADPKKLRLRPPVVTVMGHVDHGKTTLLDSLRHTHVVQSEFGGITQHIGAFSVTLDNGAKITFLDTPGHAAFKAMRARGANATDIVVLVVAADDGVMEQTVESIRMAREANVPIIVAINKIDKPESDIERTSNMLAQHEIQVESLGGDIQAIPVSALKGTNLEQLTEAIALQAEILDLKADPTGLVEGVVIESSMDPHRGKLSTLLVQRGTLHKGSVLVCDTAWAKVRAMFDQHGQAVTSAPPSTAIEVLGWRDLPPAGHIVLEVDGEKRAHEIVKWRESQKQEERQIEEAEVIKVKQEQHLVEYKAFLEKKRKMGRFKLRREGPRQKEIQIDTSPMVHVLVKGDVDGTVEAILDVLETYDSNNQCKLDVVHYGVGNISESDIELAESFNAIIYAFNIECPSKIEHLAASKNVPIKFHNVIYKLVDDLKEEINSKLPQLDEEQILGEANVLQQFLINDGRKKIPIAGCRCVKGILKKNASYRLVRSNEIIHEGSLDSMRHLKNEVDSIKKDVECGLQLVDKTIEFKPGDTLVCYEIVKVNQKTEWDPGF